MMYRGYYQELSGVSLTNALPRTLASAFYHSKFTCSSAQTADPTRPTMREGMHSQWASTYIVCSLVST